MRQRSGETSLTTIRTPISLTMAGVRPVKRARTQPAASTSTAAATPREGLFAPFRSLGHVSTGVPFVVQSKSSKFLETPAITVVTSLGRSWAMWEGQTLKLLFVGEFYHFFSAGLMSSRSVGAGAG